MPYDGQVAKTASKALESFPEQVRSRILERLTTLNADPFRGSVKIQGDTGYRVRVGDYRILFDVDAEQSVVRVWRVAHRRESYRQLGR